METLERGPRVARVGSSSTPGGRGRQPTMVLTGLQLPEEEVDGGGRLWWELHTQVMGVQKSSSEQSKVGG